MPLVRVGVDDGFRADLNAVSDAVTERTAVVVGSAPTFPHGVIDPIPELAALAAERGAGCHVDACLGGFIIPWAERLGYPVPAFDFRLPGVTSMSADTHKYGYAAKGSSVVLYRGKELRQFQYYTARPTGRAACTCRPPSRASRPGALSAECWAAMVSIGERGYVDAARQILETGARVRDGVRAIPGLRVLGDPLWVTAFAADEGLDVFQVMENMTRRGWSLNGLQRPAAVHIAITLRHTRAGVADRFLEDLRASVDEVRASPDVSHRTRPDLRDGRRTARGNRPRAAACLSRPDVRGVGMERHILAIDLGTSALKVALVSISGQIVASEQEACQVELRPDGGAEQDPEGWWTLIARASSRLMARAIVPPESVVAVSCTAQWSGTVAVDERGRPIRDAIIWMDARGGRMRGDVTGGPVRVQGYGVDKLADGSARPEGFPRTAGRTPSRTSCGSSTPSLAHTAAPACSWSRRTG